MIKMNKIIRTYFQSHPKLYKEVDEICPYCKNTETNQIVDSFMLKEHKNFHLNNKFKLFNCFCCGAFWHFDSVKYKYIKDKEGKRILNKDYKNEQ